MTWSSWVAILGAMAGTVGATSGIYSYVASAYRVKAHIGIALGMPTGGVIRFDESQADGFATGVNYLPGSEKFYVLAWNHGRMPINVDQINIFTKPLRDGNTGRLGIAKFDPPSGDGKMPHRLDYGSSSLWLYPLGEAMSLSKSALSIKPKRRGTIQVELMMGDNKIIKAENSLSPEWLDLFIERWSAYQAGTTKEIRD